MKSDSVVVDLFKLKNNGSDELELKEVGVALVNGVDEKAN